MKNLKSKVGLFVGAAVLAATQAHAALDPAAATAISAVSGSWTELSPLVYGAMGIVTGGLVVFGLVKKSIKKVA